MIDEKTMDAICYEQVECEPFKFHWDHMGDGFYVQARLWRKDTDTGDMGWGHGGKYYISRHATLGDLVKKLFVAARDYAEHEVREAFTYNGRAILGPHIDINELWNVATRQEKRG